MQVGRGVEDGDVEGSDRRRCKRSMRKRSICDSGQGSVIFIRNVYVLMLIQGKNNVGLMLICVSVVNAKVL
ncbi:Uncharacterised protein [Yersinia pseudotuberculosis]|uniref:Uncharacterized protein n=2 Tax=Yersinia pseudotuberculosis complex TaxID=1649845 RepID=A0A380Q934_YERPU|nr:Uncharacterised protein [Yersinia pseudotuberculosis]CRG51651.1 Uncharacterised protein [Yersinia wautersii]CRY70774.1 Uncharacterised protein [Yersinia pseudotuberculosis]SUP83122.1 Uncharacterised protein [Yersinia pseudotuberculosis]